MFRFPTKTLGVAALSLLALTAAPAQAATIYQSISDLSAFPAQYGWCSTCDGSFAVYDGFSLSAGASINQIDFNVLSTYNFPSPVTIQIFKANAGQAGSEIFGQTYAPTSFTTGISPFLNVVDHGTNYTSTVSVDLAGLVSQGTNYFIDGSLGKLDSRGLSLDAGDYYIEFYNPTALGIPGYDSTTDTTYYQSALPSDTAIRSYITGQTAGFALYGTNDISAVPLPTTLPLFGSGLIGLVAMARRRKA